MNEHALNLTTEEHEFLERHLRQVLNPKRVEIHRTESQAFRKDLEREVELVESLLRKLSQPSYCSSAPS